MKLFQVSYESFSTYFLSGGTSVNFLLSAANTEEKELYHLP